MLIQNEMNHIWFWERIQKRHPKKDLEKIARVMFETGPMESVSEQRFRLDRLAQQQKL